MVQDGVLDGIPVKEGSLFVQGLENMTWHEKYEHRTHHYIVQGLLVSFLLVFFNFISSLEIPSPGFNGDLVHKTKKISPLILRLHCHWPE